MLYVMIYFRLFFIFIRSFYTNMQVGPTVVIDYLEFALGQYLMIKLLNRPQNILE